MTKKETLMLALETYEKVPTNATREFIGRVLTGIFKYNCSIDEI